MSADEATGQTAGPGSGPGGAPSAIALSPILSARYRSKDLERIRAAAPGARLVTVVFKGQSEGTFDHYFELFLPPIDILLSFVKVLSFALLSILIHCYYGFTASGGPAGVGVAVGTAVRRSIVTIALIDFFLSLALWGATTTVRIAG